MSNGGVESWAGDLGEMGAVYPMQGTEPLLLIICVGFWLFWHVWCVRWERRYHREKIAKYGNSEHLENAVEAE